MQPNRLERVWKNLKPEILRRWNKITDDDLEGCKFQSDLVVETIRKAYYPGRSGITLEGEIKDWLVERINFHENTN